MKDGRGGGARGGIALMKRGAEFKGRSWIDRSGCSLSRCAFDKNFSRTVQPGC